MKSEEIAYRCGAPSVAAPARPRNADAVRARLCKGSEAFAVSMRAFEGQGGTALLCGLKQTGED
jgi:hypothetical protein